MSIGKIFLSGPLAVRQSVPGGPQSASLEWDAALRSKSLRFPDRKPPAGQGPIEFHHTAFPPQSHLRGTVVNKGIAHGKTGIPPGYLPAE